MFPLENPNPNFKLMMEVLKGSKKIDNVMYAELIIDNEILQEFCEKYLNRKWVDYDRSNYDIRKQYWDNVVECYYRLGYHSIRVSNGLMFDYDVLSGNDSSITSNKDRKWSDHSGKIEDDETFDNYPWPKIEDFDMFDYEYVSSILPEGMSITCCVYGGILEMLCEYLIGFENMCYLMVDDLELLEKTFDRVGELLYYGYEKIINLPRVGAIFQGDDMGFDLGLMFSPEFTRKYILPWHKRLVDLAHKHNKFYLLHSCGNLRAISKDIVEMGVDAKHSFEDKGYSVKDFYTDHGHEIGVIGGVDVDKLTRCNKEQLTKYCLDILDHCTKNQRYVFGSGNSVANYIPLENFLTMLEVCRNYKIGGK